MRKTLLLLFVIFMSMGLHGQEQHKRKLFTLDSIDIGGYIGFNGKYTTVNSLGAGLLDFRAAVVIDNKWGVGFTTTGLLNDRHLNEIVKDDAYHLMSGYQGLYLERFFDLSSDFRFSVSFMIGQGEIKYRYCRSVIAERKWYEETIDQTDFYIIQPSIDFIYGVSNKFWIGINAGHNLTTAIRMMSTDENILNKFNFGISLKYGLF